MTRTRLAVLWFALLAGALHACSSGGDSPHDAGPTLPSVTANIGASGGTLTLEHVALRIPAGALSTTQSLTLSRSSAAAPTNVTAGSPVYHLEPAHLAFGFPVSVSVSSTVTSANTGLYWSTASGRGFERRPSRLHAGVVTGTAVHFSDFFVGAPQAQTLTPSSGKPVALPAGTVKVLHGDFSGDGLDDRLFVVNHAGQTQLMLSVGAGNGTFGSPVIAGTGTSTPISATAGDFNHDGRPDVALLTGQSLQVFNTQGTGTFGNPISIPTSAADPSPDFDPVDLATAQVETDSGAHVDIVAIAGDTNGQGTVIFGQGEIEALTSGITWSTTSTLHTPRAITVAENTFAANSSAFMVQTDSDLDVFVTEGGGLQAFENVPLSPAGITMAENDYNAVDDSFHVTVVDVSVNSNLANLIEVGQGLPDQHVSFTPPPGMKLIGASLRDVNGDGIGDLVFVEAGSTGLSIQVVPGEASGFGQPQTFTLDTDSEATLGPVVTLSSDSFGDGTGSFELVGATEIIEVALAHDLSMGGSDAGTGDGGTGDAGTHDGGTDGGHDGGTDAGPAPTIIGYQPNESPVTTPQNVDRVTIHGDHFTSGHTTVTFSGVPGTVTEATGQDNEHYVFVTIPDVPDAGICDLVLTTPAGSVEVGTFYIDRPPTIASVSPTAAAPDAVITLGGTWLSHATFNMVALPNGPSTSLTPVELTEKEMAFRLPQADAGLFDGDQCTVRFEAFTPGVDAPDAGPGPTLYIHDQSASGTCVDWERCEEACIVSVTTGCDDNCTSGTRNHCAVAAGNAYYQCAFSACYDSGPCNGQSSNYSNSGCAACMATQGGTCDSSGNCTGAACATEWSACKQEALLP
ncbi:MAG: VCBS repeat-containing protein [Deltaproteobacteria bacterium]|nr:VCBS repeat-containing protein [Deltaproteobacteria bacterium]